MAYEPTTPSGQPGRRTKGMPCAKSDYERGIHVEFGGSPRLKEKLEELNYARAAIAKALGETT